MLVANALRSQSLASRLSDGDWRKLAPVIAESTWVARHRKHDLRAIVDAALFVTMTGCAWRDLPRQYPPWQTVYYYVHRWREDGTWPHVLDELSPRHALVHSVTSNLRYELEDLDSTTWVPLDSHRLTLTICSPRECQIMVTGYANLSTSNRRIAAHFGVQHSGIPYGTADILCWQETGGGTMAAVTVQAITKARADVIYTLSLVWKPSVPISGPDRIIAGAGTSHPYSPSGLSAQLIPPP
jgi:transposase